MGTSLNTLNPLPLPPASSFSTHKFFRCLNGSIRSWTGFIRTNHNAESKTLNTKATKATEEDNAPTRIPCSRLRKCSNFPTHPKYSRINLLGEISCRHHKSEYTVTNLQRISTIQPVDQPVPCFGWLDGHASSFGFYRPLYISTARYLDGVG